MRSSQQRSGYLCKGNYAAQHSYSYWNLCPWRAKETDVPEHINTRQLIELRNFSSTPACGSAGLTCRPSSLPKKPPVVVLHGCTPPCVRSSRGRTLTCVSTGSNHAIRGPAGEALSIREMIEGVADSHGWILIRSSSSDRPPETRSRTSCWRPIPNC